MVKTPEEYFAAQNFDAPGANATGAGLNKAERAFVEKYLGLDALSGLPSVSPQGESTVIGAAAPSADHRTESPAVPIKSRLQAQPQVQMVSFYVHSQLFLLPVALIHEVLRHMPLVKLPMAPPFVAGVVNLRGRVTPLVHLDSLLTLDTGRRYTKEHFIIICDAGELQLGLIIDKVHSMYQVAQDKIIWNAEAQLGDSAEFLYGIADIDGRICGIVAPEIVARKLQGD
ncbi:MAG: chemotaxis protein CheW, partial [Desulfovibrionaceae bacterium]|nr:chemotaxis protein CheW [Desulfovibrionaceae bacterium]